MAETVSNFESKKYDQYSSELKSAFLNAYDDLSDEKNIELVLFTNTPISDHIKKGISEFAKSDSMNNFKITIYDGTDYDVKEAVLNQNSDLIPEDQIEIFLNSENGNNILSYGDSGIIVNVKASSIKRLYAKYANKGLFSYNLREHITQKSVDDGIENTIRKDKDNFWFYNNGINIGCEDYYKDGNKIRLYGFSIINGAQTTTKIGESNLIDSQYDFAVVCKVIKAEKSMSQDSDFISKISEASNSQKPIRQRDLKSNAKEQKILQNKCANNGKYSLAVEIKRGVRPVNYKKVDKWQRVTNEYIGQLIYACIFQHPCAARNQKNIMFSSSRLYNQIFMRNHDYDTLYDLVRLGNEYEEFGSEYVKKTNDVDEIAIVKNGKLTVLGVLTYLVKKQRGIVIDSNSDELHEDNLNGLLITDYPYDDLDQNLNNLFVFVIRILKHFYDSKKESMKITSYSNFFKSEPIYDDILNEFDRLDDYDQDKLNTFMIIFSEKKD